MGCDWQYACDRPVRPLSFSILERIEWAATPGAAHAQEHWGTLSVSSNGSNGLRQRLVAVHSVLLVPFQYPRTDRMGCDLWGAPGRRESSTLSVSSNGSNGLRPQLHISSPQALPDLSVSSNGSNGLRPASDEAHTLIFHTFSILERIEWAATRDAGLESGANPDFQYPRTDRMGCDAASATTSSRLLSTFSILERIEWAATHPTPARVHP